MLQASTFYYVYNHANGNENLFVEQENYRFFLQQYSTYINPIAATYAYCLMPNHFHLLIRIKDEADLLTAFPKFQTLEKLLAANYLSKQFSNFFSSYTQAFNKKYNRRGSLFIKNFKRKSIHNDQYLRNLIAYIHLNPIHHGFVQDIQDWPWSSYRSLLSNLPTSLQREILLQLFEGNDVFFDFHK